MSNYAKAANYAAARYHRAIASSGGGGFTQIFQAPSAGISLVSGMIYMHPANRTDYSFIITSTTSGTPRFASEARVYYPNGSSQWVLARGTGSAVDAITTLNASTDYGIFKTRGTALYLDKYPVPAGWYFGWELSGAIGAQSTGYDLQVENVTPQ